jgi:hypothetical protein
VPERDGPRTALLVTAAAPRPTTDAPTTTVSPTKSPSSSPARRTTAHPPVTTATSRPPAPRATTTTTEPAPPVVTPAETRGTCLALATVNHYRVVSANATWLNQQLETLTAQHLLSSPQHQALLIEESQALSEIDAQYTIDQSNCYLDRAPQKP